MDQLSGHFYWTATRAGPRRAAPALTGFPPASPQRSRTDALSTPIRGRFRYRSR